MPGLTRQSIVLNRLFCEELELHARVKPAHDEAEEDASHGTQTSANRRRLRVGLIGVGFGLAGVVFGTAFVDIFDDGAID